MFKASRRSGEQRSTKMFYSMDVATQSNPSSSGIFTTSLKRTDIEEVRKIEELSKIHKKIEAIYDIFDESKQHDIEGIIGYLRRGI
jgi:hypothetical protein